MNRRYVAELGLHERKSPREVQEESVRWCMQLVRIVRVLGSGGQSPQFCFVTFPRDADRGFARPVSQSYLGQLPVSSIRIGNNALGRVLPIGIQLTFSLQTAKYNR